jgi:ElaB/YqjD/DUF883 family membrane-anchored ribosome-binding protein
MQSTTAVAFVKFGGNRWPSVGKIRGLSTFKDVFISIKELTMSTRDPLFPPPSSARDDMADSSSGTYQSGDAGQSSSKSQRKAEEMSGQVQDKASEMSGHAQDKASEVPGKAQDKASEVSGKAQDKASEVSDRAQDKVSEMSGKAQDKASEMSGKAQDKADQGMDAAASGLGQAADKLREQGEHREGAVGNAAAKTADTLDGASQYLKDKDTAQLMDDLEAFVRQRPVESLLIAAGIGIVLSKIVR